MLLPCQHSALASQQSYNKCFLVWLINGFNGTCKWLIASGQNVWASSDIRSAVQPNTQRLCVVLPAKTLFLLPCCNVLGQETDNQLVTRSTEDWVLVCNSSSYSLSVRWHLKRGGGTNRTIKYDTPVIRRNKSSRFWSSTTCTMKRGCECERHRSDQGSPE